MHLSQPYFAQWDLFLKTVFNCQNLIVWLICSTCLSVSCCKCQPLDCFYTVFKPASINPVSSYVAMCKCHRIWNVFLFYVSWWQRGTEQKIIVTSKCPYIPAESHLVSADCYFMILLLLHWHNSNRLLNLNWFLSWNLNVLITLYLDIWFLWWR